MILPSPEFYSKFLYKIFIAGSLVIFLNFSGQAQVKPSLGGSSKLMNSALAEMEKKDFERANAYFRQIIENNLSIPPEMPYYFAETLFELGQYDNSLNFLNKYLEINGYKGDNYESAKTLETKLKANMAGIYNCKLCDNRGYRYLNCPTCEGKRQIEQACIYCKTRGVVGCTKCRGSGLVTKKNVFNILEYYECDKCGGEGKHTCPKCMGTLKELSDCRTCRGQGRLLSEEICDHKPGNQPRHFSTGFEKLKEMSH
ncbi:molecular chaperone DnaJ [Aquiflexum sp. LQ15W]|uniref:molecular chaperone DnaJ n=1 Tax=Cognataquiflexum nitidum TaxID=2922272 RepID=UPI001F14940A|nr:molecular chaperone DnaJ [Cognataquiflexum nitidum]MCH6200643.1 molecular chaperone DnaJ [Cognataquiflexum nitidum]